VKREDNVAGISSTGHTVAKIPVTFLEGRSEGRSGSMRLVHLIILKVFLQKRVSRYSWMRYSSAVKIVKYYTLRVFSS
jgi:hypothetical protein